jgi:Holliday junction DNA helicase RuvA
MIAYLEGQLTEETPTYIVLENNGVGYFIHIPLSSYKKFSSSKNGIQVFTHLHVREDALQLYGFATERERELFRMLISVSGVGPRLAQSVLSGITIEQFESCMAKNDLLPLKTIPGVGTKTAQRLMVDLREKFIGRRPGGEDSGGAPVEILSTTDKDAIKALVSLGCKIKEAEKLVHLVRAKHTEELTLEELILKALQHS